MSRILGALYPSNPDFTLADVLQLVERHPDWEKLNRGTFQANYGVLESKD